MAIGLVGLAAVWLTVCPASAAGDIPTVRTLLDAGRYAEAEAAASALVEAADGLPQPERLAARQLLVDALIRNGRGAEATDAGLWLRALPPRTGPDARTESTARRSACGCSAKTLFESADFAPERRHPHPRPAGPRGPWARAVTLADDLDDLRHCALHLALAGTVTPLAGARPRPLDPTQLTGTGRWQPGTARALTIRGLLYQRRSQLDAARADAARAPSKCASGRRRTIRRPSPALTLYGLQLKRRHRQAARPGPARTRSYALARLGCSGRAIRRLRERCMRPGRTDPARWRLQVGHAPCARRRFASPRRPMAANIRWWRDVPTIWPSHSAARATSRRHAGCSSGP